MTACLDESIPLSKALASAIRVQQIGGIAAENVRRACDGELPAQEAAIIESFEAGLLDDRLVVRGPLEAHAVGDLLVFLTELDDAETMRIFLEEADDRVGGPIWALLTLSERDVLVNEGLQLANRLRPLWDDHCDAAPKAC